MQLRLRYLALGTVLALAATGLGLLISWLLDLNWMVISILLLVLLFLMILSNTVSGSGGGPTMRSSALWGGSNPWGIASSSMSLEDLEQVDHMIDESSRQGPRPLLKESRYRWIALPSGITILAILVGALL